LQAILLSPITGTKIKSYIILVAILLFIGISFLLLPVWYNASKNFRFGEKYFFMNNFEKAIPAFEQSILQYFPFSPYPQRAIQRLFEIGDRSYQQQNIPLALQAYHTIIFSNAIISVYRNISQKDSQLAIDRIRRINPEFIGQIKSPKYPKRLWSLFLGIFLLCWIVAVFLFIQRGFDKKGKLIKPIGTYYFLLFLISFSLWLFSIIKL
jgi:hypothetical protein